MKKSLKYSILFLSVATSVGLAAVKSDSEQQEKLGSESLTMANIEALTDIEVGCSFVNGYKSWQGDAFWFWTPKKEFYDCCQKLREGYNPEGSCN